MKLSENDLTSIIMFLDYEKASESPRNHNTLHLRDSKYTFVSSRVEVGCAIKYRLYLRDNVGNILWDWELGSGGWNNYSHLCGVIQSIALKED